MSWTPHFSEHEFLRSSTAKQAGLTLAWDSQEHRANALRLTQSILEPLRVHLKRPVHITSGYRSPELTELLRSKGYAASRTSDHMTGRAVDIVVKGMTHEHLATAIYQMWAAGRLEYDQLIFYMPGTGGSCHVSYRRGANRQQSLVATHDGIKKWIPRDPPRDERAVSEFEGAIYGGPIGWSVLP